MALFVRLTLVLAAVFVALALAALVLKLVVVAAVVAALALGALYAYSRLRTLGRRAIVTRRGPISRR